MNEEKLSRAFDEITLIRGIFLVFFFLFVLQLMMIRICCNKKGPTHTHDK